MSSSYCWDDLPSELVEHEIASHLLQRHGPVDPGPIDGIGVIAWEIQEADEQEDRECQWAYLALREVEKRCAHLLPPAPRYERISRASVNVFRDYFLVDCEGFVPLPCALFIWASERAFGQHWWGVYHGEEDDVVKCMYALGSGDAAEVVDALHTRHAVARLDTVAKGMLASPRAWATMLLPAWFAACAPPQRYVRWPLVGSGGQNGALEWAARFQWALAHVHEPTTHTMERAAEQVCYVAALRVFIAGWPAHVALTRGHVLAVLHGTLIGDECQLAVQELLQWPRFVNLMRAEPQGHERVMQYCFSTSLMYAEERDLAVFADYVTVFQGPPVESNVWTRFGWSMARQQWPTAPALFATRILPLYQGAARNALWEALLGAVTEGMRNVGNVYLIADAYMVHFLRACDTACQGLDGAPREAAVAEFFFSLMPQCLEYVLQSGAKQRVPAEAKQQLRRLVSPGNPLLAATLAVAERYSCHE